MRTTAINIIGLSIVAASLLAQPALANNDRQQVNVDPGSVQRNASRSGVGDTPSNGCSSYMKAPDGSWTRIPCAEVGASASAPRRGSRTSEKSE